MFNLHFINVAASLWGGGLLHWFLPCFNTLLQAGRRTAYWVTPKQVTTSHVHTLLLVWFTSTFISNIYKTKEQKRSKYRREFHHRNTQRNSIKDEMLQFTCLRRRKYSLAPPLSMMQHSLIIFNFNFLMIELIILLVLHYTLISIKIKKLMSIHVGNMLSKWWIQCLFMLN